MVDSAPTLYSPRLLVTKFDECLKFYQDVMGFSLPPDHGFPYVSFETGACVLSLFDRKMMAEAIGAEYVPAYDEPSADRVAIIFHVPSVDAAYSQMQERGAIFVSPPTDRLMWGIRTAHLRDPDGNLLELYEDLSQPAK